MLNSRSLAVLFGAVFIFVGIIGFIPNPLVHSDGLFVTNALHNVVHVITGGVFLLALAIPGNESKVILGIGVAYVLVSILGFMTSGDYLLGIIHINQADRWLHLFLAAVILAAGKIGTETATTAVKTA